MSDQAFHIFIRIAVQVAGLLTGYYLLPYLWQRARQLVERRS